MTTFQFDECFSDTTVIESCNAENKAIAQPLPRDLLGVKDPVLLPILIPRGNPIVTIDRKLPFEHSRHIPTSHPGIVVVCFSYRILNRQITTPAAGRILLEFKGQVPDWFQLSVQNSIVILTERTIEVFHIENNRLLRDWGAR